MKSPSAVMAGSVVAAVAVALLSVSVGCKPPPAEKKDAPVVQPTSQPAAGANGNTTTPATNTNKSPVIKILLPSTGTADVTRGTTFKVGFTAEDTDPNDKVTKVEVTVDGGTTWSAVTMPPSGNAFNYDVLIPAKTDANKGIKQIVAQFRALDNAQASGAAAVTFNVTEQEKGPSTLKTLCLATKTMLENNGKKQSEIVTILATIGCAIIK